jgi:hypothetical protein
MNKLRNFLWKYLGITLDRQTSFVLGTLLLSGIAAIVFGILSISTNSSLFRLLFVIVLIPTVAISGGSVYGLVMWSLSSKSERKEMEEEIALKQLKRRVNDKHFER